MVGAIDTINGLVSKQNTLTLAVIDPCANQRVRLAPLPTVLTYNIGLEPLVVDIEAR